MENVINNLLTSNIVNSSLLIDALMDCGATYCSVTLLDQNGTTYFSKSSSDAWLNIYIDSKLYQKCHLMNEAFSQIRCNANGFTFLWDNFSPINEESLYLDRLRGENNICHGVAFCSPLSNGGKSIITVTGKNADINFSKQVLRNKDVMYKSIMKALIDR